MRPRPVKMLAISCPSCRHWVKPRRYDPSLHLCWDCVSVSDVRPDLVEAALDRLPGLAAALMHLPVAARRVG